jgi:hypothetical protein
VLKKGRTCYMKVLTRVGVMFTTSAMAILTTLMPIGVAYAASSHATRAEASGNNGDVLIRQVGTLNEVTKRATCPATAPRVVSGGYNITRGASSSFAVLADRPDTTTPISPLGAVRSWVVTISSAPGAVDFEVYALCT